MPEPKKVKRDQKFFDRYSLVIGVLAAICLGFFVLAMTIARDTAGVFTASSAEYQAAIAERLKPVAEVYMPGDNLAASESMVAAAPKPVEAAMTGPQVFNNVCIACHGTGIGGAPVFGNAEDWAPRIAEGLDVLKQHAIEGYQGKTGVMPPKGGRLDLSDDEVHAAVEYMVSRSEK